MVDKYGVLGFRVDETGKFASNQDGHLRHWGDTYRLLRADGTPGQGFLGRGRRIVTDRLLFLHANFVGVDGGLVSAKDANGTTSGFEVAFHTANGPDLAVE